MLPTTMLDSKFVTETEASDQQQQHQQQQQQQHHQHHVEHQSEQPQIMQESKSYTASGNNMHYLKIFIQKYRDLPVLWDNSLVDYSNRDKRAEAYEQLLLVYRLLKKDAHIMDVKKKINTLRTNYRKELKMIDDARKQGNYYNPHGWVFYQLDFLRNVDIKTEPSSNVSSNSQFSIFNESMHQGSVLDISNPCFDMNNAQSITGAHLAKTQAAAFVKALTIDRQELVQSQNHNGNHNEQQHVISHTNVANKNKRVRVASLSDLYSACNHTASDFDEEETLTRTWAYKLKRLTREQRLYAEKFINDILFEAESGTLHRCSMQLNAFEPFIRFEEPLIDEEASNASRGKTQSPHIMGGSGINIIGKIPIQLPLHHMDETKDLTS